MKSRMITGCNSGICVLFTLHAIMCQSPHICIWFAISALSCIIHAFLPRAVAQCTDTSDLLLLKTIFLILGTICLLMGLWNLYLKETLFQEFLVLGCTLFAAGNLIQQPDENYFKGDFIYEKHSSLANTIKNFHADDIRISSENRKWADSVLASDSEPSRDTFVAKVNSGILDIFVQLVRKKIENN